MLNINAAALALLEVLRTALFTANSLDGTMAYQSHAFGKIQDALVEATACAIADSQVIYFDDARKIAARLVQEAINNGEDIAYQIGLWNKEQIELFN
jgi:hypothetical protein